MEKGKENIERLQRRFCEATDGSRIRRLYATMRTADLAREMGLTVKQIENYVYWHNTEPLGKQNRPSRQEKIVPEKQN